MKMFWKAVDKIIYLYCCQLLMTDEEVEEEVESTEIMGVFLNTFHCCYHEAMVEILEILHTWMEVYMIDGSTLVIHRGESH